MEEMPALRQAAESGVPGARTAYGAALRERDEYPAAESWLRRAVDAGESDAPRLLALTLMESGRADEAADTLSPLVASGRHDLASLLGHVYDDLLNESEKAEEAYRVALSTGSADVLNDYGVFLLAQERHAEAEAVLRRAIDQGDVLAPGNLARTLLESGRVDEALSTAVEYAGPDCPSACSALAEVYVELGDDALAHEAYERAVTLGAPRARVNYGEHLYETGEDLARAEALLRDAFDEFDEPGAGYVLACLLISTGRRGEGVEMLEHVESWGDPDAAAKLQELGVR